MSSVCHSTYIQPIIRRPPTAEARVRYRISPCGICGGQNGTGTGLSPSTSASPCQFYPTGAPLLGKGQKIIITIVVFHHRVAQEASRLRCVRNVCCGALHHLKKPVIQLLPCALLCTAASVILSYKSYRDVIFVCIWPMSAPFKG
jgi:hypothetical protein